MEALRAAFDRTRRDTIGLVRELDAAEADPEMRVRHNDLGELTLRGWLAYLDGHAKREVIWLKS